MDAVMASGTRYATSHVHLVEGFSVLTIACLQTVGLTPVETLLWQLIVRKDMLLYRENRSIHTTILSVM